MFRSIVAYLARPVRRSTFGSASPAELAAQRQKAYDAYAERTRLAGVKLSAVQADVIAEVNGRIAQAQQLAAYAAQQLDDLADNGVLDGSNVSPAQARSQAKRVRDVVGA